MSSKADWPVIPAKLNAESQERKFFTEHEWLTIEAATARIYPSDQDPGAREAGVVRFIDRYLSGIDYIYASADGSGFLQMSGKLADAWRGRIADLQNKYRKGIRELDEIARGEFKRDFSELTPQQQDQVLEKISGKPKPKPVTLTDPAPLGTMLQGVSDDDMPFFEALALHTRQGMFADPAYGGNKDRVGWEMIGFPGPKSLADTNNCTFSVKEYFVKDFEWEDLIPQLKKGAAN